MNGRDQKRKIHKRIKGRSTKGKDSERGKDETKNVRERTKGEKGNDEEEAN